MNEVENHLSRMYIPTLRVIMTSACNGECFFCHREGNSQCRKSIQQMSLDTIENEIVPAINKIGIKKVIFTGGEPTLHKEIATSIQMVKQQCNDVQVGITTNGFDVGKLENAKDYIDRITISASSLKEEVFMRYTKINPLVLIDNLKLFGKTKKSVSIVLTTENVNELDEMINLYLSNNFDIKLQFIISDEEKQNINWRRKILYELMQKFGKFQIKLGATPTLCRKVGNSKIRIKLATLNVWMYDNLFPRNICMNCEKKRECVERGCAIRIFPDGKVTPCLNHFKSFSSENIMENLEVSYRALEIRNNIY
ncbi:MAG: radical SAM protein [Eubacterium sp.]|mgnify:CR=1 FL=1|nr:radical SAM protein [Eubacterium sp.]